MDFSKTSDRIEQFFDKNFTENDEVGASVSVWHRGEPVVELARGWCEREKTRPWTTQTIVPVYSATKGPAAATVLLALEKAGMTPELRVRDLWPKFPVNHATIANVLAHRCGLAALDQSASIFHHEEVVEAIEVQKPAWKFPNHGYHPRTFGALTEEIVQRLTGTTLGEFWRREIAEPLGLEFWIGLDESQFSRVAHLYPGKIPKVAPISSFYQQFSTKGTLINRAFCSPQGLVSVREMNTPKAWCCAVPSLGGVGTASALAKFYQACLGFSEPEIFSEKTRRWMSTPQSAGMDEVLLMETAFSCGFMKDPVLNGRKIRAIFGPSRNAFGHPGAGGSHAFADPESGFSFAYTMNQMELGVFPNKKSLSLVSALFDSI